MNLSTVQIFNRFMTWLIMWLDILDSIIHIVSFTMFYPNFGMSARVTVSKFILKKRINNSKKRKIRRFICL